MNSLIVPTARCRSTIFDVIDFPPDVEARDKCRAEMSAILAEIKGSSGDIEDELDLEGEDVAQMTDAKARELALDNERYCELKAQLEEISPRLTRIGGATPTITAWCVQDVMGELIRIMFTNTRKDDSSNVQVESLFADPEALKKSVAYCLVQNTAPIVLYNQERETQFATNQRQINQAVKAVAAKKKEMPDIDPADLPQLPDIEGVDTPIQGDSSFTARFQTYIEKMVTAIKKEGGEGEENPFLKIRTAKRIRYYLSEVATHLIRNLASASRVLVHNCRKSRTLDPQSLINTLEMVLTNAYGRDLNLESRRLLSKLQNALKRYNLLKSSEETTKLKARLAAMSAEERAEYDSKQTAAQVERDLKSFAALEDRARKAASKYKTAKAKRGNGHSKK
jgi:hypothetical protein